MLKAGDVAPDFTLVSDDNRSVSLSDFRGKTVVLYFYPKADTSGCTTESCEFRDNFPRFSASNAVILGASPDTPKAQAKFKAKYGFQFPLLADEGHGLADAFGVWKEKSMYGRKYMGVERTTFIIDKKGEIARVFQKVKPEGHAAEVAEALDSLR
jgi:peroxiredoxin Q/BCP